MVSPQELVARFGGHACAALGLDLDTDAGLFRWLVLACLLSGRVSEQRATGAFRALEAEGLTRSAELARAEAAAVAGVLDAARVPRPEQPALLLTRLARALRERSEGSLTALAAEAAELPALGSALVGLAPGLGPGTALRFLRPLRERWPAARETPLSAPARAAAQHLGWIGEVEDEDGAPGALIRRLATEASAPAVADLEAALERLGRRSCASQRPERCALAEDCPVR